jgi:ceramide glucosyltransferase
MIIVILVLAVPLLVLTLYAVFSIRHAEPERSPVRLPADAPLVSLLKPVKTLDDGLEKNIESYFSLDYPRFEILFGVDRMTDPCVAVIERVRRRFPEVPVLVLATGHNGRQNPKVHKLALLEARSRGDLLWVTDSNTRADRDTLSRLVEEHLRGGAKLVFSPIRGTGSRTFASLIENSSLNFFTSGGIIAAWKLLRQPIVVGKSILVEAKALRAFGGFGYLKNYLAEDFLLGESFLKSGFRVSTNYTWVTNVNERSSLRSFFDRMARWAKLRYSLRRGAYLAELLLNPIMIAAGACAALGGRGAIVLPAVVLFKVLLEYVNFLAVNREDRKRLAWHLLFPAAVVVKDFLFLLIYLVPFLGGNLRWRGTGISIGRMTLIGGPRRDEPVFQGA